MGVELHINVRPDAEDPYDIIEGFPFEEGQSVLASNAQLIIVDLGEADDTNYVQDWYLNEHEGVNSFFILDDEEHTP